MKYDLKLDFLWRCGILKPCQKKASIKPKIVKKLSNFTLSLKTKKPIVFFAKIRTTDFFS